MTEPTGTVVPSEPQSLALVAPVGGVMTEEVGAITGDLEVWLDPADPEAVRVRYAGALDAYTVVGAAKGRTIEEIVQLLQTDPGVDEAGNALSTTLA